ncbi:MarR family winged helix-turn-helix transcriptional regulator [Oceanospirillum sediminis]|jgi:DNA-binding MarR family transcriptional regulator|uniref:MarR family transcriptional regulator n=1 Tax=Oceanospirillum sediminis TaxID=2760088 RepID=A0A839ILN3_9GAMM|nr:MarR family transcriptional regulator [Oceanospirillum sediminis]MBB1486313.1 MarR family transcriptional regulator [Oceanospirillum sediminis]
MQSYEEVLVAIRQIIRSIDLHSRKLNKSTGLTGPQLVILQALEQVDENHTIRELSNIVNLSQATVTTILDRLEAKNLVVRERSTVDKRKVHVRLTDDGKELLANSPKPLQEEFINKFQGMEEWEQNLLLSSVQRIARMMNAEKLDASPYLEVSSITPDKNNPNNQTTKK